MDGCVGCGTERSGLVVRNQSLGTRGCAVGKGPVPTCTTGDSRAACTECRCRVHAKHSMWMSGVQSARNAL